MIHLISQHLLSTLLAISATWFSPAQETNMLTPANDNCSNAMSISISGGGFDYNTFTSDVSDLTMASGENGEFFEFATEYGHRKSVWFEFTLVTSRSIVIKLETAPGSILPDPKQSGLTLYAPSSCLPGATSRLGSIISSGELERYCTIAGTYRIQVTAVDAVNASFFVSLSISCPFDPIYPEVSRYDCPDKAFVFNTGLPLPQSSSSYTGSHEIECHSIEDPSEYGCLPLANRADYRKSSWYVFTTGSDADLLAFDFSVGTQNTRTGYRLLEGDVRTSLFSTLPVIDCGLAKENVDKRFIEFPCKLNPNTTYSLSLLFHKDFVYNDLNVRALQRGMDPTGWPRPVLPPVNAVNELGVLPASITWEDRFDCSAFIIDNVCPPANPASGEVVIGSGANAETYDLATWATFTLATDVNIEFYFNFFLNTARYHTRIFSRTLDNTCPSPNTGGELYYAFSGREGEVQCLPAGDYAIQVLSNSYDRNPSSPAHKDSWTYGTLGTRFILRMSTVALPSVGLFRLDADDEFDAINNLAPLEHNMSYDATPAVFICENTVLPSDLRCTNIDKAIYREVTIGDYDLDGLPDEGLLCIKGLRTDGYPDSAITYQIFQGDANQLATAAGTHSAGQVIPGLVDYLGRCIDDNDITINPPGIDNFCTCVTAGTYTLASFGNVDNVGNGDAPVFNLNTSKTIHDSRENAELINVGGVPGAYASNADYFSCLDNLGSMPPCGSRTKLIYREFYLADSAVVTINDVGSAPFSVLSLFSGRASDLTQDLTLLYDCFVGGVFYDYCTAFPPGWYTIVSYGAGPNYDDRRIWNAIGSGMDVGLTSRVFIGLDDPIMPHFNRPEKAYQAGITDWATPPANNPNALTGRTYAFVPDTFCAPDTPFIPESLVPCLPIYNRIAFYVFEVTKPSFVQILNVNSTFYTEVFPFDVNVQPGSLLTVPPVYPCLSTIGDFRQICDLPPGKYTIAIFANDSHFGQPIAPYIYVDEAAESRFDQVWNAYDFDLVPTNNTFVDGRPFDTHPTLIGQAPSRDVFYCTTGARAVDPNETQCGTQLNPLIYAHPPGVPKPLFLTDSLPAPWSQPWRNLWYTFRLSGSGVCTLHVEALNATSEPPLVALYESDLDGDIPWTTLQSMLDDANDVILPGLKLIDAKVSNICDAEEGDIIFKKSGCLRDKVRYYAVVSFDAYEVNNLPNLPNQAVFASIKYDAKPTFGAPYDERPDANVLNGLLETAPPYTSVPLDPGTTVTSTDFSLLCYSKNVTDPPGCIGTGTGKSAWFQFEVSAAAQIFIALEEIGIPDGWLASPQNMTVWRDAGAGNPLSEQQLLTLTNSGHEWLEGCIDPGTYYLLIRHCSSQIDTLQPYRIVLSLADSPGDFCYNAIPIDVIDFNPSSGSALINCHTIGTDIGETPPVGNSCFPIAGRKTTWFHAQVNAGPMVDLKFQIGENFVSSAVDLSDVTYRILAGTCGAMTPIACSEGNINLTLDCLGTGDYYVQVSMPERVGANPNSPELTGTLSLTVTATPSMPETCTDPIDPNEILANFTYTSDCQTITFFNLSTAGSDIIYLWEFSNDTSTAVNPIWIPPPGASDHMITLTVTNIVTGNSTSVSQLVSVNAVFASYTPMPDTMLCNGMGSILLNAAISGATYLWDNNSTNAQRSVTSPGVYSVIISLDGCEKRDTVIVEGINATEMINPTLCPGSEIIVGNQIFDQNTPSGTVIIPGAHPSGCDSILTVSLSFYADAAHQMSETICAGESYAFGSLNLTETGTYEDTLSSVNGCDSIVTLMLTVTPRLMLEHDASGCEGAAFALTPTTTGSSYQWNDGTLNDSLIVNSPGVYSVNVFDLNNCVIGEETFTVTFGALSSPSVSVPDPMCVGTDVLLLASGSSGEYQWYDSANGGTLLGTGPSLILPELQADVIVYVQAFQVGFDTCISSRTPAQVEVIDEDIVFLELDTVICAETSIALPWGEQVQPETSSTFSHTWQSSITGCDSLELTIHVDVLDAISLSLPSTITLQYGDSVLLEPEILFVPDSLIWSPSEGLSCTKCPQPWARPEQSTDYVLSVWSPEGCLISAPLRIEINRDPRYYVPNVFSPNGDGVNDIFTIVANREIRIVNSLTLYDRWGDVLWVENGFLADGTHGWDGYVDGQLMQPGVYVWMCEIEFQDGSKERLAGDVTLVR